ncbi:polysaccharide biosynthesis C-terminal domain-containing protein [Sinimarinibacterium thermocellulolyticum]|uniref:NAD-dependent epimerase/dehydratase family protein n=1 Tax=Sinimarinibacterium thermocellulolyticum TaxID=3170016 RepID=A0ABV2A5Q6_9GAMM
MRIAITGAEGFIGWHLRCHIHARKGWQAVSIGREIAADPDRFAAAVHGADAVVHLAGVNRASPEDLLQGNQLAARQLVQALEAVGFKGRCIYTSSTQAGADHPYGKGKQAAGEILAESAARQGWSQLNLIVPHVYGEYCRPHYNSGVATFAHGIARDQPFDVNAAGRLELLHVGDLAEHILAACEGGAVGSERLHGESISVGEVVERLRSLWSQYRADEIPALGSRLELNLFNMLRGYAFPEFYPRAYTLRKDPRGGLAEVVRAHRGGQMFFSSTNPGFTRGNHYHFHKVERFAVIAGQARIEIRRLFTDEVHSLDVSGDAPVFIDMPTLHTHAITNTGSGSLLTLFWSHEFFDPAAPDTYPEPVRVPQ